MSRADRKADRRSEALARNAAWQSLTVQQQIDALRHRPGSSKRQMAKLMAKLGQKEAK